MKSPSKPETPSMRKRRERRAKIRRERREDEVARLAGIIVARQFINALKDM